MTAATCESQRPAPTLLLSEYDCDQFGPLFAVSDEGSAARVIVDAALSSAKAAAGLSNPLSLGVILDGERMTSAGEVPIGPPEYSALSTPAAGRLLLTTNVGTRVNVRLTGQLPEFRAIGTSAEAVIAAFEPFLHTPDQQPRPLTVRLCLSPGDVAGLAPLIRKLDKARNEGRIGPVGIHQLSALVLFDGIISTKSQLAQLEAIIAAAADLGVMEVAIDGAQQPYARQRWGGQGLLNVLSIPGLKSAAEIRHCARSPFEAAISGGCRLGSANHLDRTGISWEQWISRGQVRPSPTDFGRARASDRPNNPMEHRLVGNSRVLCRYATRDCYRGVRSCAMRSRCPSLAEDGPRSWRDHGII